MYFDSMVTTAQDIKQMQEAHGDEYVRDIITNNESPRGWSDGEWYIFPDGVRLGVHQPMTWHFHKDCEESKQWMERYRYVQYVRAETNYNELRDELDAIANSCKKNGYQLPYDMSDQMARLRLLKALMEAARRTYERHGLTDEEIARKAEEEIADMQSCDQVTESNRIAAEQVLSQLQTENY